MKYAIIVLTLLVLTALLGYFMYDQNKRIVVSKYKVNFDVEKPIRIVHLSDLHSTEFKNLVGKIERSEPDLIAFTGDLINDKAKNTKQMYDYVNELSKICPFAYIPGNHEQRLIDFEKITNKIALAGAVVLKNEVKTIEVNSTQINILGLVEKQGAFSDYKKIIKGNFAYENNGELFKELEKRDGFRLVLSHFPENFQRIGKNKYSQYDFDLMLSGHAHGGQFILPFVGPVFSPGQGLFPKYARGEFGEKPKLVVSRGLGNSEFPLRLFNHPEIVIIDIEK